MLSKGASSTIFWVFVITRTGIEPQNAMYCFEQILEATPHKTETIQPLTSYFKNHLSKMNKTCWSWLTNNDYFIYIFSAISYYIMPFLLLNGISCYFMYFLIYSMLFHVLYIFKYECIIIACIPYYFLYSILFYAVSYVLYCFLYSIYVCMCTYQFCVFYALSSENYFFSKLIEDKWEEHDLKYNKSCRKHTHKKNKPKIKSKKIKYFWEHFSNFN